MPTAFLGVPFGRLAVKTGLHTPKEELRMLQQQWVQGYLALEDEGNMTKNIQHQGY
jgi:hypothetical protein